MSSGAYVGSKHTVYDIYPIKNKTVFVLADPQNIDGSANDFRASMSTLSYLLDKKARIVLTASFGPLTGISINLGNAERETAVAAFQAEGGMGYTNFFSSLPSSVKLEVLRQIPRLAKSEADHLGLQRGKTSIFASLSEQEKQMALRQVFPREEFFPCSTFLFVEALKQYFPGTTVHFAPDCLRPALHKVKEGEIMVLENMRFYKNEASTILEERRAMAAVLSADIDIFVNDSFSSAHTVLASSVELPRVLQHGAAGNSMDRDLAFFSKFLVHPGRPLVVVVAGKNIPEKLQLIYNLVSKVDRILVGGMIVFPFLAAKGYSTGLGYSMQDEPVISKSTHDAALHSYYRHDTKGSTKGSVKSSRKKLNGDDDEPIPCSVFAKEILELCEHFEVDLVLPSDYVVSYERNASASDPNASFVVESSFVPENSYIVDCGSNTIHLFSRCLRDCRTIFWTGPLGATVRGFNQGSIDFATAIGKMDIVSVVGGRTTLLVVREAGMTSRVLHSSSGGTSSLEILHGDTLPGVEALSDAVPPADRTTTVSVNELLRRLPLFQGCTSHQMKVTAKKFVRRVHAKGDYIIYRDDRHARMWVVAEGGLVAYNRPEYSSFPARYVGKGQTVGMYEFITQAPAKETVRAAQVDTVTYQLTSSALNELLNAHPDLAAQLLQNISDPLRLIAAAEYRRQQSVEQITWRAGCRTRTPFLNSFPSRSILGEDILQEILSTVCLQKLMMRYTPFVEASVRLDVLEDEPLSPGVVGRVLSKLQMYSGLPYVCILVVLKNVLYHHICNICHRPLIAAVISAAVSAPLRVLSYGISYNDVSTKMMMDEALISATISVAPLACYATGLVVQNKLERRSQSRISRPKQIAVMVAVKALFSCVLFPFIYQRNFLYTQPSASRFWDRSAFKIYQLKQCCELLLNLGFHSVLSLVAPETFQN